MRKNKDENSERSRYTSWKDLDRRGKFQYIIDYYLLHIILVLGSLVFFIWGYIDINYLSSKPAMFIMGIDAQVPEESAALMTAELGAALELDERSTPSWEDVQTLDSTNYDAISRIYTLVGANAVDAFICNDFWFETLGSMSALADLSVALEPDEYKALEEAGRLLTGTLNEEDGGGSYVMGIDLTGTAGAERYNIAGNGGGRAVLSISISTPSLDMVRALVRQLIP